MSKIVIVLSEKQGKKDTEQDVLATLIDCYTQAGLSPTDIQILHYPEPDKKHPVVDTLDEEIKNANPSIIVPAGNVSLNRILGFSSISKQRGKLFRSEKYNVKVIPIISPSAILLQGKYKQETIQDLKKIKAELEGTTTNLGIKGDYVVADTLSTAKEKLAELAKVDLFTFDIETTDLSYHTDRILGLGFSYKQGSGMYIPLVGYQESEIWSPEEKQYLLQVMKQILENDAGKIGHNVSFDIKFIRHKLGILPNNVIGDTLLMSHLIDENRGHGLKELAYTYTDLGGYDSEVEAYKQEKARKSFAEIPLHILGKYCCIDADVTLRLYHIFREELKKQALDYLFDNLVMPLRRDLIDVELLGVKVDRKKLIEIKLQTEVDLKRLDEEIKKLTFPEFKQSSPKQLQKLLFEDLKLPIQGRTPSGGASTDVDTLKALQGKHPVVDLILENRKKEKLYSTYLDPTEAMLDENDRLHCDYRVSGTATGRLSSARPNLQNISSGSDIRSLYIPKEGCKFGIFDYSMMELRIACQYSQDRALLEIFEKGHDLHTEVTKSIFSVTDDYLEGLKKSKNPVDQKKYRDMRDRSKCVSFGVLYGSSAMGIAEQLKIPEEEGQAYLDAWFKRFSGVRDWQSKIQSEAAVTGQVRSIFGRIRRLPDAQLPETYEYYGRRGAALRQAINSPIQGGASDCTSLATIKSSKKIREMGLQTKLVLTVHDELVAEIPISEIPIVAPLIKDIMEHPSPVITVPLRADVEIADDWSGKIGGSTLAEYLESLKNPSSHGIS